MLYQKKCVSFLLSTQVYIMKQFHLLLLFVLSLSVQAQSDTGRIETIGATIYYKIYGNKGKPTLLIGGGPGFSSNYLHQTATELSKQQMIILYDQRGTGKSTVDSYDKMNVSIHRNVKDIEALRNHFKINKLNIIGHAYGSALAMMYANKYPNRVDKLILSSTIGLNLDFVQPMMANLKLRLDTKSLIDEQTDFSSAHKGSQEAYRKRFDLYADAYIYNKANLSIAREMHNQPRDYVAEINQILWEEMINNDYSIEAQMKYYRGKVLIIHGRQDVIGESVPIYTHQAFPNSELLFINEASRYIWLDQPEVYYQTINDFLK